jgi:26S proteasome regulatory subunit N1
MQVSKLLISIVHDFKVGIEVVGFVALALGLVYVGSCNEDVAQSIILTLMDHGEVELGKPLVDFLYLGLGFIYLGKHVMCVNSSIPLWWHVLCFYLVRFFF